MSNLILRIIYGTLMGVGISLLLWVLIFEHLTFFIITPLFPLVGFSMGLIFACLDRIKPRKLWVSLLAFTVFVGLSFGYSELRGLILRSQRLNNAIDLAMQYPESEVIGEEYSVGNGMEYPPSVKILISNQDSFENIARYYDSKLRKNGWEIRYGIWQELVSWRKNSFEIFLRNKIENNTDRTTYSIRIDYLGYWMKPFPSAID